MESSRAICCVRRYLEKELQFMRYELQLRFHTTAGPQPWRALRGSAPQIVLCPEKFALDI